MNTSPSLDKTRTPQMFTSIARRYDLLNHLLSLNIDRSWRSRLVASAGIEPGQTVVDAATGTADVAIAFARQTEASRIIGIDRSTGMLDVGREKVDRLAMAERVRLVEGDCLALPVADGIADAATIAFGLRNLPDYGAGVAEMARVLKPGGRLLVLEFFPPRGGVLLRGYKFYLGRVLPIAGRIISGSTEAYSYLAASIENFISHDAIRGHLEAAGLGSIQARKLTGGIAYVYCGVKK